MPILPRPLRSVLFIPGNRERWLARIPSIEADSFVLDLEDSVPAAELPEARRLVRATIERFGREYTLFVRVNSAETPHLFDDLEAVTVPGLYGISLAKTRGPADVIVADAALTWFERRSGAPEGSVIIDPNLETAAGMRLAYEVATASPRVAHMGASMARNGDAARDLGIEWTDTWKESLFARSKIIMDARAAGVQYPLMALWVDIHDLDGLRAFCEEAKQLGYTGMKAIHPDHLPIIHDVFSPTAEEIAYWEELIALLEEAERNGTTAVAFRGAMVDTAMVKTGRDRLALARRLKRE